MTEGLSSTQTTKPTHIQPVPPKGGDLYGVVIEYNLEHHWNVGMVSNQYKSDFVFFDKTEALVHMTEVLDTTRLNYPNAEVVLLDNEDAGDGNDYVMMIDQSANLVLTIRLFDDSVTGMVMH